MKKRVFSMIVFGLGLGLGFGIGHSIFTARTERTSKVIEDRVHMTDYLKGFAFNEACIEENGIRLYDVTEKGWFSSIFVYNEDRLEIFGSIYEIKNGTANDLSETIRKLATSNNLPISIKISPSISNRLREKLQMAVLQP